MENNFSEHYKELLRMIFSDKTDYHRFDELIYIIDDDIIPALRKDWKTLGEK